MYTKKTILIFILFFSGCFSRANHSADSILSIQIVDKNGFSQTINQQDRLKKFNSTEFISPQPYQKVTRVYGNSENGRTSSKINTYHPNGQPWQYLEVENGRSHGKFFEWHPNGELKIDAFVIEGIPDPSPIGQASWLFDGISHVFDEQGKRVAEVRYEKGLLEGESIYFHPNEMVKKKIIYSQDEIDGLVHYFDEAGKIIETNRYKRGKQDGISSAYWSPIQLKYEEYYEEGRLLRGEYFSIDGTEIARVDQGNGFKAVFEKEKLTQLIQFESGIAEGSVSSFSPNGALISTIKIKNGIKHGEEREYYLNGNIKLSIEWAEGVIEGIVKSWYENGILESQREIHQNQKEGIAYGWFEDGELMLMETYEKNHLIEGLYFEKGKKEAISKVEHGKGIATILDKKGHCLRKVVYEEGEPKLF